MFTESDYEQYFQTIKVTECNMLTSICNIISETTDAETLRILEMIKKDEISHSNLAEELLSTLTIRTSTS